MGTYTADAMTTGDYNTALGYNCLTAATTGHRNTAVGSACMENMTTGEYNTAVGQGAMYSATSSYNVAVGQNALYNSTASYNTAVGYLAGQSSSSGVNNISIGWDAQPSNSNNSNEVTLGNGNITALRCQQTSISSLSDRRDKTDIVDLPVGLDFVNSVRPVKFKWATREGLPAKDGTIRGGFIAQELQDVMTDFDASWLDLVHEENPERMKILRNLPVLGICSNQPELV
mgnify:CR=1 FL=1